MKFSVALVGTVLAFYVMIGHVDDMNRYLDRVTHSVSTNFDPAK